VGITPFFGKIGWLEAALIIGIVLVIFGPGKLPGLSKSIGQAIRNFTDGLSGKNSDKEKSTKKTETE